MITIIAMYSAAGAVAGVLAGLLGIGGGLIVVPMLVFGLHQQGVSEDIIMHLSLGTSMASIMFTSVSSFMAHHRRGAVKWLVVKRIVVGIFVGTFLGSCVAARLSTTVLKVFFVIFLIYVALQMLTGQKPKAGRDLPGRLAMFGVGNVIGAVSSLVGIGGGTLSVPFMLWCNIPLHQAIGTSAAIGFPIAVAGTIGYVYNGLAAGEALPHLALGYVYLPALAGLVAASVLTAPLGVRLAHSLPVARLKAVFAVLLLVVAARMIIGLF